MKSTELRRWRSLLAVLISFSLVISCHAASSSRGIHLDRIQLPSGFKIRIFASQLPNARSLTQGTQGTIFVGSRQAGRVYAVLDLNRDHIADEIITIADGLNMPNGVAFRDGALYRFIIKYSSPSTGPGTATSR